MTESSAMNMQAIKTEPATALVQPPAASVAASPKQPVNTERYVKMAKETAARVIPPLVVVILLGVMGELICRRAGSTLPPPSKVFSDTKELIFNPFFDNG